METTPKVPNTERNIRLSMLAQSRTQAELDAIAYLSNWGGDGYDTLHLYQTDEGNLNASYTDSRVPARYFIMGLFDQDKKTYSFHS